MKKQKIYEMIGHLVVLAVGYIGIVAVSIQILNYIVCNCITTIK